VAVTNVGTAPPVQYTLTDTLAFGAGIVVNTAEVTGPPDEDVNPSWNGSTDTMVVARGSLGTGETDHFTVTVNTTVTSDATADDVSCTAGGGFLNTAQVSLASPEAAAASAGSRSSFRLLARAGAPAAVVADPTATQGATACADGVISGGEGGGQGEGTTLTPDLAFTGAVVAGLVATGLALLALGLLLAAARHRLTRHTAGP
jgi:hypothetical protein